MIKAIDVYLKFFDDEVLVGRLRTFQREIYFQYDEGYLKSGFNISPLKLAFNHQPQKANQTPFNGLFGVFNDSLPDGWGMLLLNRKLEEKGELMTDLTPLDHLSYVGNVGRGALVYKPVQEGRAFVDEDIDLDHLLNASNEIFQGTSSDILDKLFDLGGASGGARPKFHVLYHPELNQIKHSSEINTDGYEPWIIKFPSLQDAPDIANIEYAYYLMAIDSGIEMMDSKLLCSKSGKSFFATKRFDRPNNSRLHVHSVAGLVHDDFRLSNIDYGHILDLAFQLEESNEAREKVLRIAAFNVFSHNRDDHSKNFSWLMNHKGIWSMSPAYDLTYSNSSHGQHSTLVSGEGANPGEKHLLELASVFSMRNAKEIINQVREVIKEWSHYAQKADVREKSRVNIGRKISEIK